MSMFMLCNYQINKNGLQDTKYFQKIPIGILMSISIKGPFKGLNNESANDGYFVFTADLEIYDKIEPGNSYN